jgi:hypothetical protein
MSEAQLINMEVILRYEAACNGPRRWKWALGAAMLLLGCAGCSATLDDGYRPQALNASSSQRRAYYATPFTPESDNAAPDQPQGPSQHRPGAY